VADRGGVGDADAIEAERERFACEVPFTPLSPCEGADP